LEELRQKSKFVSLTPENNSFLNLRNKFFFNREKSLRQYEKICETAYWQKIRKKGQARFKSPEGVCTDEFLSRKPGFLLSAMHSHAFRWFSAAPLVFLFLGLLPLQLYQIWRIFFVMYGEECGWTLFVWLQKLYITEMFEWLLSFIQL
jgi:hypothetical protein